MNIAFDPREWSPASPDTDAASGCAHPDWHGLRARLYAGLEAWASIGHTRGAYPARTFGSFSRRAMMSLERINANGDLVNQTSSANRKSDGCIIPQVAGMSTIGERG
jgi:hypothetical protein